MKVVYLSKTQLDTLTNNGTVTVTDKDGNSRTITYDAGDVYCIPDTLYRHDLVIVGSANGTAVVYATLYLRDDTEIDTSNLGDYFPDHYVQVSGVDNGASEAVIAAGYISGDLLIREITTTDNALTISTVTDTVTEI